MTPAARQAARLAIFADAMIDDAMIDDSPVAPTASSMQRRRALALLAILDVPGLPDALWYVDYGRELADVNELTGQLYERPLAEAHAAIETYANALGLVVDDDKPVSNFTQVSARGTFEGVAVKVWVAADKVVSPR